jgi:hypothetical protein
MTSPTFETLQHTIDMLLPVAHVRASAHAFLATCNWQLEIDEEMVTIPHDAELCVRSRAFVKADVGDVFLDDHFEAVVLIGKVQLGPNVGATYGVLRLYFNAAGQFISEDRYNKYH